MDSGEGRRHYERSRLERVSRAPALPLGSEEVGAPGVTAQPANTNNRLSGTRVACFMGIGSSLLSGVAIKTADQPVEAMPSSPAYIGPDHAEDVSSLV